MNIYLKNILPKYINNIYKFADVLLYEFSKKILNNIKYSINNILKFLIFYF